MCLFFAPPNLTLQWRGKPQLPSCCHLESGPVKKRVPGYVPCFHFSIRKLPRLTRSLPLCTWHCNTSDILQQERKYATPKPVSNVPLSECSVKPHPMPLMPTPRAWHLGLMKGRPWTLLSTVLSLMTLPSTLFWTCTFHIASKQILLFC